MFRTSVEDTLVEATSQIGGLIRLVDVGGQPALPAGINGSNLTATTKRLAWSYSSSNSLIVNLTYADLAYAIWDGTTAYGRAPTVAKVIAFVDKSASWQVRIYDITNNQVIAESAVQTGQTPAIVTLSPPANFSAAEAVYAIQGRKIIGAGNIKLTLGATQIDF